MALIEDVLKGNLATGLAIGIGAVVLGPTVIQTVSGILRPAAKGLIKGSMVFYNQTLAEIGEMAADLVAEARAELDQEARSDAEAATPQAAQEHHATV
jgi:hypothetical protein